MHLLIDEKDLKLLLEEKREYIGIKLIDSLGFCLSVLGLGYGVMQSNEPFTPFNTILLCVCLLAGYYGIKQMYKAEFNNYTHKNLCSDVEAINIVKHEFSLAVIRNTFEQYPNKFLMRYDKRWKCWLLPYYKTNKENNTEHVKSGISIALKIDVSKIEASYKTDDFINKFSKSDKVDKYYHHLFYDITITEFPEIMRNSEFDIDDQRYKWFTLDELMGNKEIMEANWDVIKKLREVY